MHKDVERVLISEEELKAKVAELGKQISEDYRGKPLLLVCILKGSVVFMSDLMRAIDIDCKIDFMSMSSYYSGTKSSGQVRIVLDLNKPVQDYDLLIVEDILDSGITLSYIKELLLPRKPRSIKICTLLDKPERRVADIKADYSGFSIPDEFVIGYGLDYDEKYRNLPYVGVIKPEAVKNN
ncbi:MAG: hypoxanthine phosphoribosyltransferase [Clostridia bacterium]|nr:hypoxanthine phosphoribosyltransferase [Clostridia bacterium]MBQ7047899.1 hypoxanthine phosphoribosyltransferase [Clostridia bacterium]